jgi:hypothetical protein
MRFLFTLFITCALAATLSAQAGYPRPPLPSENLFYIQRSGNYNTIVYDANLTQDKKFDAKKPVNIYWIRYTHGGAKEDLTFIQRNLAYGVTAKRLGDNYYEFHLVSYAKKKFILYLDAAGNPCAKLEVNGKQIVIRKIFISIEESSRWTLAPKIEYVEFYGSDPYNGKDLYEKFYP